MDESLPPTTTRQQDKTLSGQRQVNLIWEVTQAIIAVAVTLAVIYASIVGVADDVLTNAFFLIVGFYYSRTNHTAIGGIGVKATEGQEYRGR